MIDTKCWMPGKILPGKNIYPQPSDSFWSSALTLGGIRLPRCEIPLAAFGFFVPARSGSTTYRRHRKINIPIPHFKLLRSLGILVPLPQTLSPRKFSALVNRKDFWFRQSWICILVLLFPNCGLGLTVISLCLGFFICEMRVLLVTMPCGDMRIIVQHSAWHFAGIP